MSFSNLANISRKKIVWAIDAFAEAGRQERGTRFIDRLSGSMDKDVEPVFVLTPHNVRVRHDFFPAWIDAYRASAESILKNLVKKCSITKLLSPRILIHDGSKRDDVDTLLKYCGEQKVEAIVVSSHFEERFLRIFHRSFAEILLIRSACPVVILNPLADMSRGISHIVFPTDFRKDSFKSFEAVLRLAKAFKARLTIYCKNQIPLYLASQSSPYFHLYFEEEVQQRKELAQEWVDLARDKGVSCKAEINENVFSGQIGECILDYSLSVKADLIFMVSKSSALGAFFGTSISRFVARNALCPVYVVHA